MVLSRMNVARERFSSIICGKYIYVFGGFTDTGITNSCERYFIEIVVFQSIQSDSTFSITEYCVAIRFDIENNSWTAMKSMKVARYWSSAAALNGCIYVAGGVVRSRLDFGFVCTNSVEMYDPACDEWIEVASVTLNIRPNRCTLLGSNGCLFLFDERSNCSNSFVPQENHWTDVCRILFSPTSAINH